MVNDERDAFLRRGINYHGGEPESWERTHDANGNYLGPQAGYNMPPYYGQPQNVPPQTPPQSQSFQQPQYAQPAYDSDVAARIEREINSKPKFGFGGYTEPPKAEKPTPVELSDLGRYIPPDVYDNFVIYRPQNYADVEKLIDYLRSRKPAIVDLEPICDSPDAQRVLDFTSGAVYALGGKIASIKPNLFLIVSDKGKISQSD